MMVRSTLYFVFGKASIIYLPILTILLVFFVFKTSQVSYEKFSGEFKQKYEVASDNITENGGYKSINEYFYGDTVFDNLIIISRTSLPSLWSNGFISALDQEERIIRFAVFGRLMNWSNEEFLTFMSPKNEGFKNLGAKIFSNDPIPGLGYWLLFNNINQAIILKDDYIRRVNIIYDSKVVLELLSQGDKI